ncbi:MAG TPA: hypothetical protein VJZ73_13440 [Methylomirabilota bacterium]|nr:hypothetical protein [Methylomirabilota bacterium]
MTPTTQTPAHKHLAAIRAALVAAGTRTVQRDRHARIEPCTPVRVTTHLGAGVLVSVTDDAWVEVQLDGETRQDEYPIELVELA